jgi:hypothetical protein
MQVTQHEFLGDFDRQRGRGQSMALQGVPKADRQIEIARGGRKQVDRNGIRCPLRVMLRTAQSLPLKGLSTLGFDPIRFQTKPPVCYRAS